MQRRSPRHNHDAYCGHLGGGNMGGGYGYEGNNEGVYYIQQPQVIYYKKASRAAVMQQQKRQHKAMRMQMQMSYSNMGNSYAYAGAYAQEGGDYYDRPVRHKRKKMRRARRHVENYGYDSGYSKNGGYNMQGYNPGYVIHYGPTMSKGGGY
jgi:hypothetical protein